MFFRRSPSLAPVHQALAQGRYEEAFALLEWATRRQRNPALQAEVELQLAAVYALYGREGREGGVRCLHEAAEHDPSVVRQPLYRALYWEFRAHQGDRPAEVKRGALAAGAEHHAMASFHAASALFLIEAYEEALALLSAFEVKALPNYLVWRRWSLLGQVFEQLGDWNQAADAFEQSASLSSGYEQQGELLNLAASWLEAGRTEDALSALANVKEELLDPADRAVRYYLEGRAQFSLGNPNLALSLFLQASQYEASAGEASYSLQLVLGQTYAALGEVEHALAALERTAALAPAPYRAYALHECAFVLVEAGRVEEAKEVLWGVVREDYDYHAEIYADLADVEYRLGNLSAADELARRALELGAVAPACLSLGSIACEYFRLDEAIAWFEQAASASQEGDREWLAAQEMLAEVRVQQGLSEPQLIIRHAQAALKYLQPADERRLVLESYIQQAKRLLGGHTRVLN